MGVIQANPRFVIYIFGTIFVFFVVFPYPTSEWPSTVSWRGRTTSPTEHNFRVYLLSFLNRFWLNVFAVDIFIDLKQLQQPLPRCQLAESHHAAATSNSKTVQNGFNLAERVSEVRLTAIGTKAGWCSGGYGRAREEGVGDYIWSTYLGSAIANIHSLDTTRGGWGGKVYLRSAEVMEELYNSQTPSPRRPVWTIHLTTGGGLFSIFVYSFCCWWW